MAGIKKLLPAGLIVVLFALALQTVSAQEEPETCQDTCGLVIKKESIIDEIRDWCLSCNTGCITTFPQCLSSCGTRGYCYTSIKVITTTYTYGTCTGTGSKKCPVPMKTEDKVAKEQTTEVYKCDTEPCCFAGPFCMPWVHMTSSTTVILSYVAVCVCE